MARMRELKDGDLEGAAWDPSIPREWQKIMNHNFNMGNMISIRGAAMMFPCHRNRDPWFGGTLAGIDYATTVPTDRWNHDLVWDANPEGWKAYKSFAKHCCYMD